MRKNDIVKEKSKDRLKAAVQKRIKTTMIGSISSIEKIFGDLWGHECEFRTAEQEELYQVFVELRTEILDNGNLQIRSFENDLQAYEVEWTGYHLEIPILHKRKLGE